MEALSKYSEELKKEILSGYKELIRICREEYEQAGMKLVRKSLDYLIEQTPLEQAGSEQHAVILAIQLARMMVMELGIDALGVSAGLVFSCMEHDIECGLWL